MTIPAGCIGGGPPPQWNSPDSPTQGAKGGKLEITLSVSLDDNKSSSKPNTRGGEHHFNDDHLYGGGNNGHNCRWGNHGGGGQHNTGGLNQGGQPGSGDGVDFPPGNGQNPGQPPTSGDSSNGSINDEINQRNVEIREQTLEALNILDQANAASIRMSCIAQTEKMVVDTNNSVLNGYVDSSSKASNASIQSSKSINF